MSGDNGCAGAGTHVASVLSSREGAMKLIGAAIGIAVICAAGLGAQTSTTTTREKKKIEVKDGKDITISGCLESNPGGG